MPKTNRFGAFVGAILCAAVFASNAAAADFCVGPSGMPGCPAGSTQYSSSQLAQAIDATISNGANDPDRVYVYSDTYTSPDGFDTGDSIIRIHGVGPTKPVLEIDGPGSHDGKTVLSNSSESATFQDLAISLPAADGNVGISATSGGATLRNIDVTGPAATNSIGLKLGGSSPEVFGCSVDLPYSTGVSTAISVSTSSRLDVRDLRVSKAYNGIMLADSLSANIQRAAINAPRGIEIVDSPDAVISSSLLLPSVIDDAAIDGFSVRSTVTTGEPQNATSVFNSTLVGRTGSGSHGVVTDSVNTGSQSTINLDSTVIYGHDGASLTDNGGTSAVVNLSYSRYQGTFGGSGSTIVAPGTSQIAGDPGFTNTAARDFSLRGDSSLIDAGNPGSLADSSGSDLLGNPRIVSRGAGNIRDIGAYEFQSRPPEPRITIVSDPPISTTATLFSAESSSDPDGDPLSYSWRFDGNSFASGITALRQFTEVGLHQVELTVTDSTGRSESTMRQFRVDRGVIALQLRRQRVRLSRKGQFSITAKCPDTATTNCTGRMILETRTKIGRKRLRVSSYVFSIEPGTTRRLNIRANPSFRRALQRSKKLDIALRIIDGSTTNAFVAANSTTAITVLASK